MENKLENKTTGNQAHESEPKGVLFNLNYEFVDNNEIDKYFKGIPFIKEDHFVQLFPLCF